MKFCNPAFLRSPGPARETLSMCLVSSLPSATGFTSLARIFHERFCCNRGFAAATSAVALVVPGAKGFFETGLGGGRERRLILPPILGR
jgi:hypothetical protein